MGITIRLEKNEDYRETENVTREAFWDVYKPGCDEHLVQHKLRQAKAFVGERDFVACDAGRIIGNIVYSKARVIDEQHSSHEVLCLGPVCVLPEYQRKGIGTQLIKHSIAVAKRLGYPGIILTGNPKYYGRFGFSEAKRFGITNQLGKYVDYLLTLELSGNGMDGIRGRFYDDEAFHLEKEELDEFEKGFPAREEHFTNTQLKTDA